MIRILLISAFTIGWVGIAQAESIGFGERFDPSISRYVVSGNKVVRVVTTEKKTEEIKVRLTRPLPSTTERVIFSR